MLYQMDDVQQEGRSVDVMIYTYQSFIHELTLYAFLKRNSNLSDKMSKLAVLGPVSAQHTYSFENGGHMHMHTPDLRWTFRNATNA